MIFIPFSQYFPKNVGRHEQIYSPSSIIQVPPFLQSMCLLHSSSTLFSQITPVKPSAQWQTNQPPSTASQSPKFWQGFDWQTLNLMSQSSPAHPGWGRKNRFWKVLVRWYDTAIGYYWNLSRTKNRDNELFC